MQHKLACNPLSSVGISATGELLVWGSNKYYILGQRKTSSSVSLPANLKIAEKECIVTDVSLGEFHAACVVNDRFTNCNVANLVPLTYAAGFFKEIRTQVRFSIEKDLENNIIEYANRLKELEKAERIGSEDQEEEDSTINGPAVTKKCFCLYLQEELKILYKDPNVLAKLLGDIEYSDRKDCINIRELRDQILGYRYSNGKVYTWGLDTNGRLGREINEAKKELANCEPEKVDFPEVNNIQPIIIKVSCGSSHTLALTSNGEVFSWGLGQRGCLGLGNLPEAVTPQQITSRNDGTPFVNIKDIACGSSHCLALNNYDQVYSWGCGVSGRLGHGSEEHYNLPKLLTTLPAGMKFLKLAAGDSHSAAITTDLELYTWGDGAYGKLGHGSFNSEFSPKHVEELALVKITEVSCGVYHTLAVTESGKVYSFGGGAEGKLGLDLILEDDVAAPDKILALDDINVVEAAAGPYHSLVLSDNGKVFAWGSNREGRLGVRSMKEKYMIPEAIPDNTFFCDLKLSVSAKKQDEGAYKEYDTVMRRVPKQGASQVSEEIILISCGEDYSTFLTSGGKIYVTGNAAEGRIGKEHATEDDSEEEDGVEKDTPDQPKDNQAEEDKEQNEQTSPKGTTLKEISFKLLKRKHEQLEPTLLDVENIKFTYISCGRSHTMAITTDGTVYCWGRNKEGQLGLLDDKEVTTPERLESIEGTRCIMVACGENHSLILTQAGEIYSCGQDENGKLGHTLMMPGEKLTELKCEFRPRKIPGLDKVYYIACGAGHSVAIAKHDTQISSSVYTWGRGWFGQLGSGRFDSQYKPLKVEFPGNKGLTFVMATCGDNHTLILDSEGNIWFSGQLLAVGLDTAEHDKRSKFTMLSTLSKKVPTEAMLYIATGQNHNLSLSGTGKVYAFGKNDYCKCGGKAEEDTAFFREVKTNEVNMSLVACGKKHSVACDVKGMPYAWGNFTLGRLGVPPKNFDQREKELLCIDRPKEVSKFKALFISDVSKMGQANADKGRNKSLANSVKYSIQRKLQMETSETKEETLCRKYILLTQRLRETVRSFANNARLLRSQMLRQHMQLANSIISRIHTFPTKIPLRTTFLPKFPRSPLFNRQAYEAIFSILQNHPCYILQLIQEGFFKSMTEFSRFIKAVFNPVSLPGNKRAIHLLTCLANDLIKIDFPNIDLVGIHEAIKQTYFYPVFRMIFKAQRCNRNCTQIYLRHIIQGLVKKDQPRGLTKKKSEELSDNSLSESEESKSNNEEENGSDVRGEDKDLFYEYNLEYNPTKAKQRALISLLEKVKALLAENLQPSKQQTNKLEEKAFSQEVMWLLQRVRKAVEKSNKRRHERDEKFITNSASSLVVYLLLEDLGILLTKKLKDLWYYLPCQRLTPRTEQLLGVIKTTNEGCTSYELQPKSNLIMIGECFTKYTKREQYTYAGTEEINAYIAQSTGYLNSIAQEIQSKEYNSTLVMLKDLVKAASTIEPVTMSVSLQEILLVHEVLYRVADMHKKRNTYKELIKDPLYMCFNLLQFRIHTIDEYPPEERNYSLNLTLPQQLLVTSDDIIKCDKCKAIVTSELASEEVVLKAHEFPGGECPQCGIEYSDFELRCQRCKRCRDPQTLPPSSLLKYYRPIHPQPVLNYLEELLVVLLPLITEEGHDFHQLLENKKEQCESEDKVNMLSLISKYKKACSEDHIENDPEAILEERLRLIEENFYSREEYLKYINFVENGIKYIQRIELKILTSVNNMQGKISDIARRVMSGLGNDFLHEIQQSNILSGSLKRLEKVPSKAFADFMKKTQLKAEEDRRKGMEELSIPSKVMKAYAAYGAFQIKDLKKEKVLVEFKLSGRQLMPVERKCYYHFFDNGDYGFNVLVIFHDTLITFWKCTSYTIECQIERFEITKEMLHEMRRNKALKNYVFFKSGVFDIFHFVNFLETIRSRTYYYLLP